MKKTKRTAAFKSSSKLLCSIEGCTDPVMAGGLCPACYQGVLYWKKKTPGQLVKRQTQLARLERRLDLLMPKHVTRLKRA